MRPHAFRLKFGPTASTSRCRPSSAHRAHRLRRVGRDDGRVGSHARVRHGRPLEPRIRRRDAPRPSSAAISRSSASATRARPRSRLRPTASSPAVRRPASRSPGPGSTNLLTGLYDAKVDRAPVLAISGQVPSKVRGRGAFQDLDLGAAFSDVAIYSQTVQRDSDHAELMNLACKHALVQRGVAHLVLPDEVQTLPAGDARPGTPSGRLADNAFYPSDEATEHARALAGRSEAPGDRRRARGAHRHRRGRAPCRIPRTRRSRPRSRRKVSSPTTTRWPPACSAAAARPSRRGS